MELEKFRIPRNKLDVVIRVLLIVFVVLAFVVLIRWAQAGIGRSIYDGVWDIQYTNCQGQPMSYENVRVTDVDDNFITFTDSRGKETKLPVRSVCSEMIMERKR